MPAGFEFANNSGGVTSYINRRPSRIVGTYNVTTTSGSYSVSGLTGKLFAFVQSNNMIWNTSSFGYPVGRLSVSGSTVSWSGIPSNRLPFTLMLGECGI